MVKKQSSSAVEMQQNPVELLDLEPEQNDQELEILAEFGQSPDDVEWVIRIYRATGVRAGKKPYLFTCTPSDFPIMDRLRDQYGSGDYDARVFRNGKLFKHIPYSVEARAVIENPTQVSNANPLADAFAQALERQTQMIASLTERLAQPSQQQQAPMETMQTMLALMATMKQFLTPATPAASVDSMLGLITKGIEIGQTATGEKGESTIMDLVRDVIKSPLVTTMLSSMPQPMPQPMQSMPQPMQQSMPQPIPQPMQQPVPQPVQQEPPKENPPMDNAQQAAMLQQNIRYLAQKAVQGSDASLYADWVYDNFPEEMLKQLLEQPDPVSVLAQVIPEVGPQRAWFEQLIGNLRQILTDESETDETEDHVSGSADASSRPHGPIGQQ